MRLRAVKDLIYLGQEYPAGWRFDAFDNDAMDLINRDMAHPFGLEDPSTRDPDAILAGITPPPETMTPVTLTPTSASYAAAGGTGSYDVSMGGQTGTWTVYSEETWITVTSPPENTPQATDGTVNYTVDVNTPAIARTGLIYTNDQTFTVDQSATTRKQR